MGNTRGTIHIDRALSDFSLKYSNGALIADLVYPRVDVLKESDKYFVYGRQDFRTTQDVRADKADITFVDSWKIESTPTYDCEEHSLADLVSDRERRNADKPLSPDFDVAQSLTDMLLLNREKRVADELTLAATWATSGHIVTLSDTATDQWNDDEYDSDAVDGSIEYRIDTGKEAIRTAIGRDPNVIIIPAAVEKVVKRDSTVRSLVIPTHPDLLTKGQLPSILWNMRVLIPGSIYDSSAEGASFSGADVWGKNVLLAYIAPNARTPRTMTLGLTFQNQKRQALKWREDGRKSDAVEISEILDEKLVCEYCGYLIKDAIA